MKWDNSLLAPQEQVLSTMEKDGSRRWMHPRLAHGRFLSARRLVAYVLLAIFTMTPFLRIGGKPAMLLDLGHRKFTILGKTFLPTDTVLLALLLVSLVLSIFFVTALLGRVWCGWACPQTVYMEFVFRPIERLLSGKAGKGGRPAQPVAGWRKVLMYAAFLVVCAHLANTFLAYFVAPAELHKWITSSPFEHPAGFAIVAIVTGLMMFDFCVFREQTCIIACPYGRLQSVLLDKWSMIISYDEKRGEPRGKMQKGPEARRHEGTEAEDKETVHLPVVQPREARGDCIDCDMCVAVCPTGIDIRRGLQCECIGCAQCIDACDTVMDKIGKPRGLVRYSSQSIMAGEPKRIVRPRVIIYSVIIVGILSLLSFLLGTKASTDVAVMRRPMGAPFVANAEVVENIVQVKITNRTDEPQKYTISLVGPAELKLVTNHAAVTVPGGQTHMEMVQVHAPPSLFFGKGVQDISIRVTTPQGPIDRPYRLCGPASAASTR